MAANKILSVVALMALMAFGLSSCEFFVPAAVTKAGISISEDRTAGASVDDTIIWTKIKELYLQKNVDNLFAKVDIQVHEGRVLLTGVVQEPETRVEASVLAWQPVGVKEVINEIQIANTQSIKDFAKDVVIATQVRAKLLVEKNVKSVNYTVDCINGVVYLMGIAQDEKELKKVAYIASHVKGVVKVISHVQVKNQIAGKTA